MGGADINQRRPTNRMNKILVNIIQCKHCGDIIRSKHRYDLKWCRCGCVAADGRTDYLKRLADDHAAEFVELSKYEG